MVELVLLGGLVLLWMYPQWAVLNKIGVMILLLMAPSAAVVFFLAPDLFRTTLVWWTVYLGGFLGIGSLIVMRRISRDRRLSEKAGASVAPWSPVIADALKKIVRILAPVAIVVGLVASVMAVVQGGNWGLLLVAAVPLTGLLPFLYLWLITKVADLLFPPVSLD